MLAAVAEVAAQVWEALRAPLAAVDWSDWHGFWLQRVVLLDPRFTVFVFLPLVPVLLLFPPRHLRLGIVLTGLAFAGYAFGLLFVPFWLAMCAAFYLLAERYAFDLSRQTRLWWNPSAVVILCLAGWYVLSLALAQIPIAPAVNRWLFEHAPFVFPLGARPVPWEAYRLGLQPNVDTHPPGLFFVIFFSPQTCGLVIFVIRMMHYFSELKRGTIPAARRTFLNFLAFNSFGPLLVQGPIERFRDFDERVAHCHARRSWAAAARGLARIGLGTAKNLFVMLYLAAPLLAVWETIYRAPERISSYAGLFFFGHVQVLAIYLLFSGYCDVAIGAARLVGYPAPENFRRFYFASSLTDIWRRWHITFSFILRDYVFLPLARRRWKLLPNMLLTFIVCGLLHNLNGNYLVWGAVMALMLVVEQKWARWMRRLDGAPRGVLPGLRHRWRKLRPLPWLCGWLITMNAFALSSVICLGPLDVPGGYRVFRELVRRPLEWLVQALGR